MNKYLVPILSLLLLTCESPERVWDNPNDEKTTLDPSEWSPTNLVILGLPSNKISLNWEYDWDNIDGFKIDRKFNQNNWLLDFATVGGESRKWTDSSAIPSYSAIYNYRIYAYAGSNTSGYNTVINNENSPEPVDVKSIWYTSEGMWVLWDKYSDDDFTSYQLLSSTYENPLYTIIDTIFDINSTIYAISDFNPLIENWFKIRVTNDSELSSIGSAQTNEINNPPIPSVLSIIPESGSLQIVWSQFFDNENDFSSYKLFKSSSEDMSNQTLIFETDNITNTGYIETNVGGFYQITTEDIWGLKSTSNIEYGEVYIYLWGESYNLSTDTLDLSNSGITGEISSDIGKFTNLTILNLSANQLTGEIPSEIGNLTNLTHLILYGNQLTGEIPLEIGNLTNLIYLNLGNNQITGIPPEIGNLISLRIFHLCCSQLTGEIPSEIGSITNLEELYLSNNALTGLIPSELGNLINLQKLYLFNNQLNGEIPSELGNLTNINVLKLNNNNLSGEIHNSICDLDLNWDLNSIFNISDNQLCPPYPICIEGNIGNQDTSDCD